MIAVQCADMHTWEVLVTTLLCTWHVLTVCGFCNAHMVSVLGFVNHAIELDFDLYSLQCWDGMCATLFIFPEIDDAYCKGISIKFIYALI